MLLGAVRRFALDQLMGRGHGIPGVAVEEKGRPGEETLVLLFYVALQCIQSQVVESARVDGQNDFAVLIHEMVIRAWLVLALCDQQRIEAQFLLAGVGDEQGSEPGTIGRGKGMDRSVASASASAMPRIVPCSAVSSAMGRYSRHPQ